MWNMLLIVFIKKKLFYKVTFVDSKSKATGIGNRIGNKGGMITYFNVNQTSFAFINCHLAAGVKKSSTRNDELKYGINNILALLDFLTKMTSVFKKVDILKYLLFFKYPTVLVRDIRLKFFKLVVFHCSQNLIICSGLEI